MRRSEWIVIELASPVAAQLAHVLLAERKGKRGMPLLLAANRIPAWQLWDRVPGVETRAEKDNPPAGVVHFSSISSFESFAFFVNV